MKNTKIIKLILSLFIVLYTLQSHAQTPSIKVGDVAKLDKDVSIDKTFTGDYKGSYIFIERQKGSISSIP